MSIFRSGWGKASIAAALALTIGGVGFVQAAGSSTSSVFTPITAMSPRRYPRCCADRPTHDTGGGR